MLAMYVNGKNEHDEKVGMKFTSNSEEITKEAISALLDHIDSLYITAKENGEFVQNGAIKAFSQITRIEIEYELPF